MNTSMTRIHREIDELSERRADLWYRLSQGRDTSVLDELKELNTQLAELWQEHRQERARIRWGERDEIVKRARAEERLERAA